MSRRGRAPKLDSMQIRHTVRVSDAENKRISEYCERTGQNKSDLYREAMHEYLKNDINDK